MAYLILAVLLGIAHVLHCEQFVLGNCPPRGVVGQLSCVR